MKQFFGVLILSMFALVPLACRPQVIPTPAATEAVKPCLGQALTIGDLSGDPSEVTIAMTPFANYLAERVSKFGYDCGKVLVPDTIDEVIQSIKNQEIDIYMDSVFPATLVSEATGAEPILRRLRNCDAEYYSILFTTPGGGIQSIEDLAGKKIAMDWAYSTSGFVLPAVYLIDHGLNLRVISTYDEYVAHDEVGIYFSFDDVNTLHLVLDGKVSAGATDDYFFGEWEKEAPGKLVVLAKTDSVPRQVVLLRSDLDSDLKAAIKTELANAHLNPEILPVMEQAAQTCRFEDTPEGINVAIEQMKEMHAKIMTIPGWPGEMPEDE